MGAEGTIWCEREAKKSKNFCLISAEVMGFIRFNWAFVPYKVIFAVTDKRTKVHYLGKPIRLLSALKPRNCTNCTYEED
jgi:hypothetical protein